MTVRIGDFFFRPATVTVHVGQTVRFVNVGKIDHTVADTSARWKTIRSKLIVPRPLSRGQAQTVRFAKPGTVSLPLHVPPDADAREGGGRSGAWVSKGSIRAGS